MAHTWLWASLLAVYQHVNTLKSSQAAHSLGDGSAISLHLLRVIIPGTLSQARAEKIIFTSCKWLQAAYRAAVITCGGSFRRGLMKWQEWKCGEDSGGGVGEGGLSPSGHPSSFPTKSLQTFWKLLNLNEGQDKCDPPDRGLKAYLSKLHLRTMSSWPNYHTLAEYKIWGHTGKFTFYLIIWSLTQSQSFGSVQWGKWPLVHRP